MSASRIAVAKDRKGLGDEFRLWVQLKVGGILLSF